MGVPFIPGMPSFSITPPATAFSTAVATLIQPYAGGRGAAMYSVSGGQPNWLNNWYTHLTDLIVTCSTTVNVLAIMRPLNWTTFSAAVAKNATAISLTDDPGLYSTGYRYPIPGQTFAPPGTANSVGPCASNNTIAAADYVAFQLADGSWHLSTIASGTQAGANLVLTTGTPNFSGGSVAAGSPCFFFGVAADTVPATKTVHLIATPIASTQKMNVLQGWGGNASAVGGGGGASTGFGINTLNPGDPLLILNPNATATTATDFVGGYYAKY